MAPAPLLLLGSPSTSVPTQRGLCNIHSLVGICAIDNLHRWDNSKMAQAQLPEIHCVQLPHGKRELFARPSGLRACSYSKWWTVSLCSPHLSNSPWHRWGRANLLCIFNQGKEMPVSFSWWKPQSLYPILLMMPPPYLAWVGRCSLNLVQANGIVAMPDDTLLDLHSFFGLLYRGQCLQHLLGAL